MEDETNTPELWFPLVQVNRPVAVDCYRWGPYRIAASSTHSGVDSGRVGTKIASRARRAVLQPPTSFQMAKCGAGERQVRVDVINHTSNTILHFTGKEKSCPNHHPPNNHSDSFLPSDVWSLLTVGRVKVWRCPVDRRSLQDTSGSLFFACCPFGCCKCLQDKETGCHMQSLVMQHQNNYIHMNDSWLQHREETTNLILWNQFHAESCCTSLTMYLISCSKDNVVCHIVWPLHLGLM